MSMASTVRSITELIEQASSKRILEAPPPEDLGLAETPAFPFLSIVGQQEMKIALLLALINPNIGGALLIGPRGTGKTTAVRSLTDLLPDIPRSRCPYGCLPEDIEAGGIDAVCPDCAKRYGQGEPLTYMDRVRLIELPLNARLEDVIGGLDERAAIHKRMRIDRGLLARADQNLLYVDEVNLLDDNIVDVILDAAAQGTYTVHRGPISATYRARFTLIGSMNPEEGRLRPQILDRFGLRVIVRGLEKPSERLDAYRVSLAYKNNPRQVAQIFMDATESIRRELESIRDGMHEVSLTRQAEIYGLQLIQDLEIDSLRAEITLFEAARAHAIADGRNKSGTADVRAVAPMALRLRRSDFMKDYLTARMAEEDEIRKTLETHKQGKAKRSK
jgi:magnesium chelatase subunit I